MQEQRDGSEWITDDESGDRVPFSTMGKGITQEEIQAIQESDEESVVNKDSTTIPFLDTDSPWHTAVPEDLKKEEDKATSKKEAEKNRKKKELKAKREKEAADPIDTLTVARLREILKSRGLKVSGNKKELQARLRAEVQSMLQNDNLSDGNKD